MYYSNSIMYYYNSIQVLRYFVHCKYYVLYDKWINYNYINVIISSAFCVCRIESIFRLQMLFNT